MHFISIWKKMDYWRDKMVSNQKYKPFNVGDIFFITNGKQRCTRGYKRYKETSGLIEWKECQIFHSIFT